MSPALIIASVVALGWLVLVAVLILFLLAYQRRQELQDAARTAVCAIASGMEGFVLIDETKHEAAARLASELDPHAFGELSDTEKSAHVAAAYFTEVVRRARMWPIVSLPAGVV